MFESRETVVAVVTSTGLKSSRALVKSILDWSVLMLGSKLFAERFNLAHFIILEIIHPLAIVAFVIAGHLSSFEWKDQVFRSRGAADR